MNRFDTLAAAVRADTAAVALAPADRVRRTGRRRTRWHGMLTLAAVAAVTGATIGAWPPARSAAPAAPATAPAATTSGVVLLPGCVPADFTGASVATSERGGVDVRLIYRGRTACRLGDPVRLSADGTRFAGSGGTGSVVVQPGGWAGFRVYIPSSVKTVCIWSDYTSVTVDIGADRPLVIADGPMRLPCPVATVTPWQVS